MNKFLILPVLLIVTACGGNDEVASGTFDDGEGGEGSYTVSGDENSSETVIKSADGEVRIATGSKAVQDLPMGIKLYPGANVESSMTGMGDGASGAMLVFSTSDTQEEVIDFYRKEMAAKNIKIATEVKAGDMQMIGGERGDGEGVNISATKDGEGKVMVTLFAGGKN